MKATVTPSDVPATQADTASSATLRKRGRPRGLRKTRVRTTRFSIESAIGLFTDTCTKKPSPEWNWDGTAYPKTKRSHGPCLESLDKHSEVLRVMLGISPNGYPDPYVLRDLLVQLQTIFNIFDNPWFKSHNEERQSWTNRAMLASDKWRIMCKHCPMLVKS